mmetsp:Transcript_29198/g.42872  ORF Transcript_29198/g.42872 Transcript_29198/m.42872 type:complete len:102 (+) Transcript_29198:631-936(+)
MQYWVYQDNRQQFLVGGLNLSLSEPGRRGMQEGSPKEWCARRVTRSLARHTLSCLVTSHESLQVLMICGNGPLTDRWYLISVRDTEQHKSARRGLVVRAQK